MEKVIDENKQGQSLVLDQKEGNTKKLFIESYGCQMNFSDSEIVASILYENGYNTTQNLEDADLVLVNTCSIRDKAEQTIRKRLEKYNAVKKINPKRVDIGTIDRPPAYDVKPVSYEFLESVADRFENINTNIIYKNRPKSIQYYDKDEIKSMLKRRPLTKEDIQNMFDEESKLILNDLLENKFISLVNSSGVEFYKNLQK